MNLVAIRVGSILGIRVEGVGSSVGKLFCCVVEVVGGGSVIVVVGEFDS